MADKFPMMIHKTTHSVDYKLYYWMKRFNSQLYEPINQNSMIVPKIVKATNK